MGKTKLFKHLSHYSKKLPVELFIRTVNRPATGAELISRGVYRVGGQTVTESNTYQQTFNHVEKVNHYEKMKQALESGGENAVGAYVKGVVDRYKSGYTAKMNEEVLKIATAKAPGRWARIKNAIQSIINKLKWK